MLKPEDRTTEDLLEASFKQRLIIRWYSWWSRLLNWPLPIAKTYAVLIALTLALFGLSIGGLNYIEGRLVAAVREAEDTEEAYDNLDFFYQRLAWIRGAQSTYRALAAANPDNPWPLVKLAKWEIFENFYYDYPKVSAAAKQAVTLNGDANAFAELADFAFITGYVELGRQAAEKAIIAVPDSAEANYSMGLALKSQGKLKEAQVKFKLCKEAQTDDSMLNSLCHAEIISATREITITLEANQMNVQMKAQFDDLAPQAGPYLTRDDAETIAQRLAWGQTRLDAGDHYWGFSLSRFPDQIIENDSVFNQKEAILYSDFWDISYYKFDNPRIELQSLPLSAYTNPTTITVIAADARVISATHPYLDVDGNRFTWSAAGLSPTKSFGISVVPNSFNQFKLLWTTHRWTNLIHIIVAALPAILGVLVLIAIRYTAAHTQDVPTDDTPLLYRMFHPISLFSWGFDLILVLVAGVTILVPLWLIFWERVYFMNRLSWLAYTWLLAVMFARLITLDWYRNSQNRKYFILLGAIIFAFYLAPRLEYNEYVLVYVILAALVYFLLLIHTPQWLAALDWDRLKQIFSDQRANFMSQIATLDRIVQLEKAVEDQDLILAKGKIKPAEYREIKETLNNIIEENKEKVRSLQQNLNLPDHIKPKTILFGLGPKATPVGNAVAAVGFGLIPYIILLVMASLTEDLLGSISLFGVQRTLVNTVAVPWGPVYLFFFGFFFHLLRGNYGVTKGLTFALVLSVLNLIFLWLWDWSQINFVELWGTTVRLLVTFVFTGLMLDWMSSQFSWRQIRLSYDSPAVTTVASVAATVLTTVITAIATGTLNELLSVAAQGTAAAFGIKPPGP